MGAQSHAEVHSTRHVLRRFLHRRGEDVPSKQTHMFASLSVGNMVQRAGSAIRTRNNSGPMLAALPDPDSKGESKGSESDDVLTRRREDEDKQYETMIEFENSPDSTYTRLTVKTEFKVLSSSNTVHAPSLSLLKRLLHRSNVILSLLHRQYHLHNIQPF